MIWKFLFRDLLWQVSKDLKAVLDILVCFSVNDRKNWHGIKAAISERGSYSLMLKSYFLG